MIVEQNRGPTVIVEGGMRPPTMIVGGGMGMGMGHNTVVVGNNHRTNVVVAPNHGHGTVVVNKRGPLGGHHTTVIHRR